MVTLWRTKTATSGASTFAFRMINMWVMHHITGREVYLVPVTFDENGWFTMGDNGTTRKEVETDRLGDIRQEFWKEYTFENTKVGREWCFMQNPDMNLYKLDKKRFELNAKRAYDL